MYYNLIDDTKIEVCVDCFDATLSALCGQAFRWKETNGVLHGTAQSHSINITRSENGWIFDGANLETFLSFWKDYFDLDRDYVSVCKTLSEDESLKTAINQYYGIRILRQDSWEALCSFIISQNNNIPRICGIVERLCQTFGEKLPCGDYTFPHYTTLAALEVEDLAVLRAGFRAKYIIDAARKLTSGEVSLERIATAPIEEAREELMKIKGVGAKVAECTLLYGFGRMEAFPVDVWVRRTMAELYPNGLPSCTAGVQGIAQQYLFHWKRNSGSE